MSEPQKAFIDLSVAGKVSSDNVDDYVEAWHKQPDGYSLREYLGMEATEYSLWVRDPDALSYILKARRENRSLINLIHDEYERLRPPDGSAGAHDRLKLKRLREWLEQEGELVGE
jgi:hypothetical protein